MAQHDFDIANQTSANVRSDLNNALAALASLSSGGTAPSTTYANMLWYDTANNTLKMRSEADDGWVSIGYLDQGSGAFRIFEDTQVVDASGTQTGLIGVQSEATWQAGTGTQESLVSPAKLKAALSPYEDGEDATTSGIVHSFTSIPAGINHIDVNLNGVSLSGTDSILIQLSTGGAFAVTGYVSTSGGVTSTGQSQVSSTSGIVVQSSTGATNEITGIVTISRVPGTNTWISAHSMRLLTNSIAAGGGSVTLGGVLDGVRLTRTGSDTFDAGGWSIRCRT